MTVGTVVLEATTFTLALDVLEQEAPADPADVWWYVWVAVRAPGTGLSRADARARRIEHMAMFTTGDLEELAEVLERVDVTLEATGQVDDRDAFIATAAEARRIATQARAAT